MYWYTFDTSWPNFWLLLVTLPPRRSKKKTQNNNIKLHDNFSLYKSDYIAKSSGNASQSVRVCEKLFDSKKLITILEENEPSHFAAHLEIK